LKTLYIERSAGTGRDGNWVEELDLDGVTRIVIGTGPGSFAGVRSAIAFATGYAIGTPCQVLGLPSPCAIAGQILEKIPPSNKRLAVVGDARRGKFWIALFDGYSLLRDVFLTTRSELTEVIPADFSVATADEVRIGTTLKEVFTDRYLGGVIPTAQGLEAFANKNEGLLTPNPLPIYLNPAVRTDPEC
jgi:tRNA threonylcarbamoyladenosine biosynthesis protein TsaB